MVDLIIPIIFMLVVVLGEACLLQYLRKEPVNWRDVMFNLNSGHVMLWLFRGLEIFCYGLVVTHFSLNWVSGWPAPLMWLFALLAWDFGFYWLHRLHHKFGPLWAVHVVHHQGEHFNLSLGVRNSWYSSLTSIPFFMLLAIAGVPLSVFIAVSLLHYSVQLFNHNALTPNLGFLEKIFVTPSHHRVHHVNDRFYTDKNCGGTFIFWDKMFGTYWPGLPEGEFTYGSGKQPHPQNPFWASNQPFFQYLKLPLRYRHKPPQFRCATASLLTGALLLFSLVIGYVWQYGYGYQGTTMAQVTLFLLLMAGTLALGAIAEGRKGGVIAWLLITVALPLIFLLGLGWHDRFWIWLMPLISLHGVSLALGVGRRQTEVAACE